MIDWHSHVLPSIDDGSKSVSESLELLAMLSCQGIDTVVATPHFLADCESVESFLKRRSEAFEKIVPFLNEKHPRVLLGAEVKFYSGISRMNGLEKLCIENTNLLLLEMPISPWTEYTKRELFELSATRGVKVILAHVERYISFQNKSVWENCLRNGMFVQVNAGYINDLFTKRKAIRNLEEGKIHFIGSDCHNLKLRPPKLNEAFQTVRNKLGNGFLEQMNEFGCLVLEKNN